MQIEEILSASNSKIKEIVALQERSKLRRDQSLFIVEGVREVSACIKNGFHIHSLFFNPKISGEQMSKYPDIISHFISGTRKTNCGNSTESFQPHFYSLSDAAYNKIAYRESTEGIVAVVQEKINTFEEIGQTESPLVLVCESIEKPGNIGAILRTADACGVDAVLICNQKCDLYNPNLIRASLGAIFTKKVIACSNEEAGKWLKRKGFKIFTAQLQNSVYYYDTDMIGACAIVMGSESDGLSDYWRKISDAKIMIPMLGELDSLNVSVSAAVLCYEAIRQRSTAKQPHKQ
jgi:RNA methyltransferase, TrmH family